MLKASLLSSYIPKKFINKTCESFALENSSDDSSDEEVGEQTDVGLFFIDKTPGSEENSKTTTPAVKSKANNGRKASVRLWNKHRKKHERLTLTSEIQPGINTSATYIDMNQDQKKGSNFPTLTPPALESLLSKSVLKPGYEQQQTVPEYSEGIRERKRQRLAEKAKTRGAQWFNMPAQEQTEEMKNDLEIIRMRRALDRKHFYKKNDPLPKYFQIGTVLDSPQDFYCSRIPKKDRKRTLVEELLSDAEFRKFQFVRLEPEDVRMSWRQNIVPINKYGKKKYAEITAKQPTWKKSKKKKKKN